MATLSGLDWFAIFLIVMTGAVYLASVIFLSRWKLQGTTTHHRRCLFVTSIIHSVVFLLFYLTFNAQSNNDDNMWMCSVSRYLLMLTSNFQILWLLILSVVCYTLVTQPDSCMNANKLRKNRIIAHCTVWIYGMLLPTCWFGITFPLMLQTPPKFSCWDDNLNLIPWINDLLNLLLLLNYVLWIYCCYCCNSHLVNENSQINTEWKNEMEAIPRRKTMLLIASLTLLAYYIANIIHKLSNGATADILTAASHCVCGLVISTCICFLDPDGIKFFQMSKHGNHGYQLEEMCPATVQGANAEPNSDGIYKTDDKKSSDPPLNRKPEIRSDSKKNGVNGRSNNYVMAFDCDMEQGYLDNDKKELKKDFQYDDVMSTYR